MMMMCDICVAFGRMHWVLLELRQQSVHKLPERATSVVWESENLMISMRRRDVQRLRRTAQPEAGACDLWVNSHTIRTHVVLMIYMQICFGIINSENWCCCVMMQRETKDCGDEPLAFVVSRCLEKMCTIRCAVFESVGQIHGNSNGWKVCFNSISKYVQHIWLCEHF